jgi:TRAP-type C4-dicarboxylate transport system permease small subunit
MKRRYIRAMDTLHALCMWVSGLCLVVITLIIPWGVFTRYVLGYGSSWPEPMAVLLVIVLSFLSAALCYRDNLHIAVMALPNSLPDGPRRLLGWLVEICMAATNLFMLVWGIELVKTTWFQVIAEFPIISAGLTYVPVPLAGAITALFVLERLWTGKLFAAPADESLAVASE